MEKILPRIFKARYRRFLVALQDEISTLDLYRVAKVSLAYVYDELDMLMEIGYVQRRWVETPSVRCGHRKGMYKLTMEGRKYASDY